MPSTNTCWGIEVGANAVKAMKLEATGDGKCRAVDYAVVQHPKVLSTPDVNANDVLRVSLGQLTSQVDFSKASIAMSIPGHSSFARFAKLPPVEPKKVPEIVKFEAMQQIPFPLEQVEWDYQTFVTPDSPDIEVGIFAVTKERINERLQMLADVGITPDYVVLSPIAAYNALAYDLDFGPQTPGTIIVDIGTTSTDLVVATPGRMWVRTFPLGGHQFTEALVNQFQLSYPKAEKLKREAQDTKHARQVFQAMRPVFTDLAQDIQRSIGYFQSLNRDATLTRVIGVGSTWRLPGLRKYLKQQLGLDVYRIEHFKKINLGVEGTAQSEDSEDGGQQQAGEHASRGHAFNDASLNLVTAYGLALQGLGLNAVGGNLMPTAVMRKTMWREKTKWFGLAAGVAAAAAGVLFIGPIKNYFAAKGTTKPTVIQDVVNRAGLLKSEAQAAGVLDNAVADLRAANILTLQDRRDVYQSLVRDVELLMENANDRLATWGQAIQAPGQPPPPVPGPPAIAVRSLRTEYYPPVSGTPSPNDFSERVTAPEPIAQYPTIRVTLQARCFAPEARRFIKETMVRWLRENAKMTGRPYEIYFNESYIVQEITPDSQKSDSELSLQSETGTPREDRDRRTPGRPVTRPSGRPGLVERPGSMPPGTVMTGQASPESEVMAPFVATDEGPAPTANTAFEWYMVFKPPAQPGESATQPGGGS